MGTFISEMIKRQLGIDILHVYGAGAAGGLGAGLMAFLNGKLNRRYWSAVINHSKLES